VPAHSATPPAAPVQICEAADAWRGLTPGAPPPPGAAPPPPGAAPPPPFFLLSIQGGGGGGGPMTVRTLPLSAWQEAGGAAAAEEPVAGGASPPLPRLLVAMSDPSHLPLLPGWPLRNLLLLAAARWGVRTLSVLCVRDGRGRLDPARSFVVDVALPEVPPGWCGSGEAGGDGEGAHAPAAVGWEANAAGKLAPR
jgi:hypothetical protein